MQLQVTAIKYLVSNTGFLFPEEIPLVLPIFFLLYCMNIMTKFQIIIILYCWYHVTDS